MFKNIIGIASCKGGVGKSTIAVNLSVYMSKITNKKIGLLDADIYGPSHPTMLGINDNLNIKENIINPIKKFGIYSMSIGYFLKNDSSILLRGPMISNTINYLIKKTNWDNLDILFVDFPPGTGDIYLSLLRDFKFSGIILITTPQLISLIDVKKSILMLKKFNTKIFSIIENMDSFICENCKFKNKMYGNNNNLLNLVKEFDISEVYNINFNKEVMESCNNGIPFAYNAEKHEEFIKNLKKISDNIILNMDN